MSELYSSCSKFPSFDEKFRLICLTLLLTNQLLVAILEEEKIVAKLLYQGHRKKLS